MDFWIGCYSLIDNCNVILDNLEILLESSECNCIEGEFLVLCIYVYYYLIRMYVKFVNKYFDNLGVIFCLIFLIIDIFCFMVKDCYV